MTYSIDIIEVTDVQKARDVIVKLLKLDPRRIIVPKDIF